MNQSAAGWATLPGSTGQQLERLPGVHHWITDHIHLLMITTAVYFSAGTNHADRAHPIDPAFEEDDEQRWHWDQMADAFIVVRVLELDKVDFFSVPSSCWKGV